MIPLIQNPESSLALLQNPYTALVQFEGTGSRIALNVSTIYSGVGKLSKPLNATAGDSQGISARHSVMLDGHNLR